MNITREHVKEATGVVSTFGGGVLTGAATSRYIILMPNPLMRVAAFIGSLGLGVVVGKAAKNGTDEAIDSICAIVDEIKRIRGLIAGDGADGFALAQSRFDEATLKARTGDEDAAKALPGHWMSGSG